MTKILAKWKIIYLPSIVLGWAVNIAGSTTKRVLSTTRVILSSLALDPPAGGLFIWFFGIFGLPLIPLEDCKTENQALVRIWSSKCKYDTSTLEVPISSTRLGIMGDHTRHTQRSMTGNTIAEPKYTNKIYITDHSHSMLLTLPK